MAARTDCTSHQHQKDKMFIIRVSKAMTAKTKGREFCKMLYIPGNTLCESSRVFISGSVFAREKPVFINL